MTNNLYFENISSDPNPKGVFIISHGMAEHMGRYEWLITNLNTDGYHVISRDHRGHGVNISDDNIQGFFSDNNGWLKVRDDLESTIHYAKKKYPNLNCFLFGHSMGSWIALSVLNKKLSLNAIVLSGSSMPPKAAIMLNLIIINVDILINGKTSISNIMDKLTMRRFNAKYKPFRTPNDWISSDIESVDAYTNDSKCGFLNDVYLIGMSNGGMMAQAMACKHPELFKAVINIVGMQHKGGSCIPEKPVNFIIYGRK